MVRFCSFVCLFVCNVTEKKVFEKRTVFEQDLKDLVDRNRELVPDSWSHAFLHRVGLT